MNITNRLIIKPNHGRERANDWHTLLSEQNSPVRKTACWIQLLRKSNLFRKQPPSQNGLSSDKSDEYVCMRREGGLVKDGARDNSIGSSQNHATWQ